MQQPTVPVDNRKPDVIIKDRAYWIDRFNQVADQVRNCSLDFYI